jgi:hypothetical protein
VLLNASQSRVQEVALRLLRASVASIAPLVQLENSFHWAVCTLIQMCTTLSEFKDLLEAHTKVNCFHILQIDIFL